MAMVVVVGYISIVVVVVVVREAQLHSYPPTHFERPRKRTQEVIDIVSFRVY